MGTVPPAVAGLHTRTCSIQTEGMQSVKYRRRAACGVTELKQVPVAEMLGWALADPSGDHLVAAPD